MGNKYMVVMIALIVALGGLLMGFDASVISGVVKFIEPEFGLSKLQLGFGVASLTISASLAMLVSGPLSDRLGRRTVLRIAAVLYAISAIGSALAPTFTWLVIARMIGGLGVGASLILAPMYIAEISPAAIRGRMVSFNQLNIVVGISLAFFTNYLILRLGDNPSDWVHSLGIDEHNWRWMLGLEALPAILYFVGLFFVPRSPRWLMMTGEYEEARQVIERFMGEDKTEEAYSRIKENIESDGPEEKNKFFSLFDPSLRYVLTIGLVIAVLQQITGINAIFFYAPMIFEQSGIGTDASFIQAILVGLINLVFTVLAILLIDRIGRKLLLSFGVSGMVISLFLLAYGFSTATYSITSESVNALDNKEVVTDLQPILDQTYESDLEFKLALISTLGEKRALQFQAEILQVATHINPMLILFAILGFVAAFAISLGPVMWVLFSELFPNYIRGFAISVVGLVNSMVSFIVQWVFPWELEQLGTSTTFMLYGFFAAVGLIYILIYVPETKNKSLEELEAQLVKSKS